MARYFQTSTVLSSGFTLETCSNMSGKCVSLVLTLLLLIGLFLWITPKLEHLSSMLRLALVFALSWPSPVELIIFLVT